MAACIFAHQPPISIGAAVKLSGSNVGHSGAPPNNVHRASTVPQLVTKADRADGDDKAPAMTWRIGLFYAKTPAAYCSQECNSGWHSEPRACIWGSTKNFGPTERAEIMRPIEARDLDTRI